MVIDATNLDFSTLNSAIRTSGDERIYIEGCLGQRFIAAGTSHRSITIEGIPGNALGAYLNGSKITVNGNAQDAVGDTMNDGEIVVRGSIGDAAGYAMRGGAIYVEKNAGYRAGIHMKAYKEKQPLLMIGGRAGSFLGEYQAGGTIIVLGLASDGLASDELPIVHNFACTGMHGGCMYLRGNTDQIRFPDQVNARKATKEEIKRIHPQLHRFATLFSVDEAMLLESEYTLVTPNSQNPYRQMYVQN